MPQPAWHWPPSWARLHTPSLTQLLLPGMLGLALLVRVYIVRDLPVGLWGDSYHHTMIAQLLVDNQGLFSSWEPYAPLTTLTYHYGFHANVALLHWLTGLAVPQSLLLMGQIIGIATIAVAYSLTVQLVSRSGAERYASSAGLWAALLTGFVNTQPIYYVNWGRYTQLAGQVILPVLLVVWMEALEQERPGWRPIVLAALVTAALTQTHYIVTIFAALFVLVYLLARALGAQGWRPLLLLARGAATITALALLLALPWLINTVTGNLTRNVSGFVSRQAPAEHIAQLSTLVETTPLYLKGPLLALAGAGLLLALRRRHWRLAQLAVWCQLLLLLVVPFTLGLPGAGIVNGFTAAITLYLPALSLAAYALAALQAQLTTRWSRLAELILVAATLLLTAWGIGWQQQVVDRQFQLFTTADQRAVEWIRTATPADASFLVNAFPAYGGSLLAGSDGGLWLPLLTGRATNLPPMTYGSERAADPDYARQVNDFAARLRERPLEDGRPVALDLTRPAQLQALRQAGIDYIYLGAHASPGPELVDHIDAGPLRASPELFRLLYDREGVLIFALEQP